MALGAAKRANSIRKALAGKGGSGGQGKDGRRSRRMHSMAAPQQGTAWGLPPAAAALAQRPAAEQAWEV